MTHFDAHIIYAESLKLALPRHLLLEGMRKNLLAKYVGGVSKRCMNDVILWESKPNTRSVLDQVSMDPIDGLEHNYNAQE